MSKSAAKGIADVSKKAASETTNFGGSAFKKVYGLIDESSDTEGDDQPQTEEQEFVNKLYEKVHTQSEMI